MENTKTIRLLLFAIFSSLIYKSYGQYRPTPTVRPLCISQFALVNHACSMLPYSPVSPPSPPPPPPPQAPSPPDSPDTPCPPDDCQSRHRHHHRHRHNNSPNNPTVQECCRWLKEVDTQCVCDLLVRLPVFLARPVHAYTVEVDSHCSVTYTCPGRMIMS
ncbi:uncharacterized protein LOC141599019 [Silene latifolia]|uniref:uncharacterized protein LOC141599019 n=1 Tax=Silene latifolia TaxID=37657 RepID=UPI003D76AF23